MQIWYNERSKGMMYVYDGWFHPYDALMGAVEADKTCRTLYGRLLRIYNSYAHE